MNVYVRCDGCIRLGDLVTCDGFARDVPYRVQTHVHTDHMTDFSTSKGNQKIIVTPATKELLIAELNADLPYRTNIIEVEANGKFVRFGDVEIALYPSGHMIGSVMVVARYDGFTCAYTSDFSWPLAQVPEQVDVLITDSTYGNPALVRNYTEDEVIESLIHVVRDDLAGGCVLFTGHKGRLQYAAQLIHAHFQVPMIVTNSVKKTLPVFEKYRGLDLPYFLFGCDDAKELIGSGEKCFVFAEPRNKREIDQLQHKRRVILSPYMVGREQPVQIYEPFIRVALTDHADFNGTIALIQAIGPQRVIADSSRAGNAETLAEFINCELNIPAISECTPEGLEWGT